MVFVYFVSKSISYPYMNKRRSILLSGPSLQNCQSPCSQSSCARPLGLALCHGLLVSSLAKNKKDRGFSYLVHFLRDFYSNNDFFLFEMRTWWKITIVDQHDENENNNMASKRTIQNTRNHTWCINPATISREQKCFILGGLERFQTTFTLTEVPV